MRLTFLTALLLFSLSVQAAEIEAGAQHVMAMSTGDTGTLDIESGRGFAAFVDAFWSPRFSTRVAGTFVNPAAILFPEQPPPSEVDLETIGLDVYSVTARIHTGSVWRLSGFAGAGGALVVIGNLDDRFGDDVVIEFDPELTFVVEAGLRYRIHPRISVELNAAYMPLEAKSKILRANDPRVPLPAAIGIDPMIVSAGASWRF